ncbi:hypothetical protein [Azospirillum endophyticum]|nr:hypothetical protein [Azospirillum endophyticum]
MEGPLLAGRTETADSPIGGMFDDLVARALERADARDRVAARRAA